MGVEQTKTLFWYRQDLRLADNPALRLAAEAGRVLPVYILDDENAKDDAMGAASRVWLHASLESLKESLGGHLSFYQGDAARILQDLVQRFQLKRVTWNRCYEPWRIARDSKIKEMLESQGVEVISANASLLWEPWQVKKEDGSVYKVFTPFYRKGCLQVAPPREPLPVPNPLETFWDPEGSLSLDSLGLTPKTSWDHSIKSFWSIGEQAAKIRLDTFIMEGLAQYKDGRNFPSKPYVSYLSPYLHMGQISPQMVWHTIKSCKQDRNTDHFLSELGWREFSYYLLYHNPSLRSHNLQPKFNAFPWREDPAGLKAWQKGQTGIPIVDAGMRQLWQTGYVHNRVRMIVASFLVKNLRIDWRHGERWFWDTLVDADLANNAASWQWVAGSGADAAPYFRIFNCVTQGKKFDDEAEYIRSFVPELAKVPTASIFAPWELSDAVLAQYDVRLGDNYPRPICDLRTSREEALEAFHSLKKVQK